MRVPRSVTRREIFIVTFTLGLGISPGPFFIEGTKNMNDAFDELAELVGRALAERWLNTPRSMRKRRLPKAPADVSGHSGHRSDDKPHCDSAMTAAPDLPPNRS